MKTCIKLLFALVVMLVLTIPVNYTFSQTTREVGNLVFQDIPEIPDHNSERLNQYLNTRSASFNGWLPDGSGMLITTRFGNTGQFHLVNQAMGARKQITFHNEPVGEASICPIPGRNAFLFTKDAGGNEFSQIFWYNMESNQAEMISDGLSVNFGMNWSNKGDRFCFTSTRRNAKDFDIYVSQVDRPREAELLIDKGTGYWIVTDWSPDDTKLIIVQYLSATKTNSYVYDIASGDLTQLNDPSDEATFLTVAWNDKGHRIYVITDKNREFKTLAELDPETGMLDFITDQIPWDVENFAINKTRSTMAFTVNNNGFNQLYLLDTETNSYTPIPGLPVGQIQALDFHPGNAILGLGFDTPRTPGDVFALDLATLELERWTQSEVGGLETSYFPEPELITYKTFDKVGGEFRKIPAFVYQPEVAMTELPVLISIHGGPEGQHRPGFSSLYAYLANELGIAVISPNVRGSDGYGKSYLGLDNGYKREESVKDIGALLDYIAESRDFDEDRVGVIGGSYGGYMVLASMVHFNDRLKCGIDEVGISNFVTFLENTEAYRRDLRRVEYGDERDPDMRKFLQSISPVNSVEKITKPMFVVQGANDPRVPQSESEQMVKAIRDNGGEVWYMLGKDEGHGFRKKENRNRQAEAMVLFLETFLF